MRVRLTEVQKAYLLGRNETFDGNIGTHMYAELIFEGDIKRFESAFNQVIRNQPMLRAKVLDMDEFEIIGNYNYKIKVYKEDTENYDIRRLEIRNKLSHKFYSSTAFPFYTFEALTKGDNKYIIFVSVDLLIADGLSLFQLLEQIKYLYIDSNNILDNKEEKLLFINQEYFKEKQSRRYARARAYWGEKVKTLPDAPHLKILENRIKNSKFARKEYSFDEERLVLLERLSKKIGLSLNSILLSFYGATLTRWSETEDITINMTTFKRPRKEEYLQVIGDFTSTILVDMKIDNYKTLTENVLQVQKTVFNCLKYSSFEGIEVLREMSKKNGNMVMMPYVFTSMLFDVDNFNDFVKFDYWISETPQVYIDCQIKKINNTLNISWDYLVDVFEESQIEAMFNNFIDYIKEFLSDYENTFIKMKNKELKELKNIYVEYNSNRNIIENITDSIENSFTKISRLDEDRIAFVDKYKSITFKELGIKSKEIKYKIQEYKNKYDLKKIRVGIQGEKSIERIIDMLAVIGSGDSFCFISHEIPVGRKNKLESVSELNIYLKDGKIYEVHNNSVEIPEDELYIIFTSGTTGTPKGISINQRAALNTIDDIVQRFSLDKLDVIFNISELSFDLSIFDVITPLLIGCKTILCKNLNEIEYFNYYLGEVTFWNSTPGIVQAFLSKKHNKLSNLKYILMSGDFISNSLVNEIKEKFKDIPLHLYSLGGATEASIWSIYYPIDRVCNDRIPYGYPLSNQQIYILNEKDELLPPFVEGEIVIAGKGLANGYLNVDDNERVFYNHKILGNIYRTGDKGYLNNKGFVNIVGRIKSELKVNGYRVDLVEIENTINSINGIKASKVLVKNNKQNISQLIAFYTTLDKKSVDNKYIREKLKNYLPNYMIPSNYLFLTEIPLNSNGKVDSKYLLSLNHNTNKKESFSSKEIKMIKLWSTILQEEINIDEVSKENTFFDLGGDSIKLTELVNLIREEYKINLTIEEILTNFTLKELTDFINKKVENNEDIINLNKNIVKISSGTNKSKNIILIHAGSGEVAIYNNLTKLMLSEYNIYAIKLEKDLNNVSLREINFTEIAKEYNKYLKEFDSIDLIGGWCIGGTLGFEIAKLNPNVKKVLLINSLAPVNEEKEVFKLDLNTEIEFISKIFNDSFDEINNTHQLWEKIILLLENNNDLMKFLLNIIPKHLSRLIPFFGNIYVRELIYYINLFRSFERARFLFKSNDKITKPIIYIGAKEEEVENYKRWKLYTSSSFKEEHIDGDHTTIFSDRYVEELANAINKELINIKNKELVEV